MTTILPSICLSCTNLDRSTVSPQGTVIATSCTAFPGGIPDEILDGADHREARGGEVEGRTFAGPTDEVMFRSWRQYAAALHGATRARSPEGGSAQSAAPPAGGQFALGGGRVGSKGKSKPAPKRRTAAPKTATKPAAAPNPNLSFDGKSGTGYGIKGGDARVRTLQAALNRLGLTDSGGNGLAVDGRYGPRTTSSVKKLQKALGMTPDGKATPELLKRASELKQLPAKPSKAAVKKTAAAPVKRRQNVPKSSGSATVTTGSSREAATRRSRILATVSRSLGECYLVDGVCIACTPQVVERRYDPSQERDPNGEWGDGVPGPNAEFRDVLNLAHRIQLAPGETFGGSARVHDDSNGDATAVMARVDGPDGPRVRFGVVLPEDSKRWRAADKGGTVELDGNGVRQLREVVAQAATLGKKNVADYRAALRTAHKTGVPDSELPDSEADIASGIIHGSAWGDIRWSLTREYGSDYIVDGVDLGPGGEWNLALSPADSLGEPFYLTSAAKVKQLDQALGGLIDVNSVRANLRSVVAPLDEASRALTEALDEVWRARHVRTAAGAKKYGLPIGSVIGGGHDGPHVPGTAHAPDVHKPSAPEPKTPAKAVAKAAAPAKKPRTTAKDRLVSAINDHIDGKGDGQPLKGFSRPQLLQVAKARGVKLDRGESEESIAGKLLDHARGGKSETPARDAPKPAVKTPPKAAAPAEKPAAHAPARKAAPAKPASAPKPPKATGTYTGPAFTWGSERKQKLADELIALKTDDLINPNRGYDHERAVRQSELEDALSSTERDRVRQLARIGGNTDAWRRKNQPDADLADLQDQMAAKSKAALDGKPVAVRVSTSSLRGILDGGRFKSQFETHHSGGLLDPDYRADMEKRWFGLADNSDPKQRPIYGYVAVDGIRSSPAGDGALDQYGDIQVVLKDNVKDRTTAVWGDSLNIPDYVIPEPLNKMTWQSYGLPTGGIGNAELKKLDRDVTSPAWREHNYVEAQIHGGVAASDIAEVVLAKAPDAQLRAMLDKADISWRVS